MLLFHLIYKILYFSEQYFVLSKVIEICLNSEELLPIALAQQNQNAMKMKLKDRFELRKAKQKK